MEIHQNISALLRGHQDTQITYLIEVVESIKYKDPLDLLSFTRVMKRKKTLFNVNLDTFNTPYYTTNLSSPRYTRQMINGRQLNPHLLFALFVQLFVDFLSFSVYRITEK